MPAKSQAQRGLIFSRFGRAWAKKHHFDNPGKLPKRVRPKKRKRRKARKSTSRRKVYRLRGAI